MIRYSSNGWASEYKKNLIISILSKVNKEKLVKDINNVINIGETSGTDFLCGVYIGCRIMINPKNRRLFSNGSKH